MRIAYHLGVHCTDEDRLVRTLHRNADMLAEQGIEVPAPDLLAALTEALPSLPPGTHVWFAGHEAEARAARALLAGAGLAKRDFTAVAYWS